MADPAPAETPPPATPGRTRFPLGPTIVVLLAVAAMIWLGVWQLRRAAWKDALLARYATANAMPPVAYPLAGAGGHDILFRRARAFCLQPVSWRIEPGRSVDGRQGWRHIAACRTGAEGPGFHADAGWSAGFDVKPQWRGGDIEGVVASLPEHGSLLATMLGHVAPPATLIVARGPAPGLAASAPPRLDDIPNNHRAYAVQWFIFAGLAIGIYAIALGRRLRPAG